MPQNWLKVEHKFIGQARRNGVWGPALIILKQDLAVLAYLPFLKKDNDEAIPHIVEAQIDCWQLKLEAGTGSFSFRHNYFETLMRAISTSEEEKKILLAANHDGLWTEIAYVPERVTFINSVELPAIPEEWGITFYPDKCNSQLLHLIENPLGRNARCLPDIFSVIDKSLYFKNYVDWTLSDLQARLRLITSCLSLFAGTPITSTLIAGRKNKNVVWIQIDNIVSPNEFICPSQFNAQIDIKDEFIPEFKSTLVNRVEELIKTKENEKCMVLLAYARMLLMAMYDDAKIAFSFQLIEALAKYKGIRIGGQLRNDTIQKLLKRRSGELCDNCLSVLKQEIKTGDEEIINNYIESALDAINDEEAFDVDPAAVKKIARWYRNEVFHGSFFERMEEIEDLKKDLPDGYKRDLPLVCQAIALVMAANFILGLDFKHILVVKRELGSTQL